MWVFSLFLWPVGIDRIKALSSSLLPKEITNIMMSNIFVSFYLWRNSIQKTNSVAMTKKNSIGGQPKYTHIYICQLPEVQVIYHFIKFMSGSLYGICLFCCSLSDHFRFEMRTHTHTHIYAYAARTQLSLLLKASERC